jgi:hypothetical protein
MQIDRVMDAFAAHYCAQNPYLFQGMGITFTAQYQSTQLILGVDEIQSTLEIKKTPLKNLLK